MCRGGGSGGGGCSLALGIDIGPGEVIGDEAELYELDLLFAFLDRSAGFESCTWIEGRASGGL